MPSGTARCSALLQKSECSPRALHWFSKSHFKPYGQCAPVGLLCAGQDEEGGGGHAVGLAREGALGCPAAAPLLSGHTTASSKEHRGSLG